MPQGAPPWPCGAGAVSVAGAFASSLGPSGVLSSVDGLVVTAGLAAGAGLAVGEEDGSTLGCGAEAAGVVSGRSAEHTSELQSLMRNSYAVLCLTKKKIFNTILFDIHVRYIR